MKAFLLLYVLTIWNEYVCGVNTLSVHPQQASLKVCLTTVGFEPVTFGILVQCSAN